MLGLYLCTLIISFKSCNVLSILNKLTLPKKLQIFVTNNVFLVKTQQQQTKQSNIKTLAESGNKHGALAPKADALPLHHRVN